MVGMKRTRTFDTSLGARARRRETAKRRRIASGQKGYVRTSGFYGRFQGNGGEHKFLDTDVGTALGTMAATMESVNLNVIIQGTTESNRIGRKCTLTNVSLKGILTLPTTATAANTTDTVRLLLVCDKQTNGAAFVATDLWETDSYAAFNNLANTGRFRILKSKVYSFNSPAGSGRGSTDTLSYGSRTIPWKMNAKLNLPIEFNNAFTDGRIATQRSNSLWLVSQSTGGLVGMNVSTSRIRFVDA